MFKNGDKAKVRFRGERVRLPSGQPLGSFTLESVLWTDTSIQCRPPTVSFFPSAHLAKRADIRCSSNDLSTLMITI